MYNINNVRLPLLGYVSIDEVCELQRFEPLSGCNVPIDAVLSAFSRPVTFT